MLYIRSMLSEPELVIAEFKLVLYQWWTVPEISDDIVEKEANVSLNIRSICKSSHFSDVELRQSSSSLVGVREPKGFLEAMG